MDRAAIFGADLPRGEAMPFDRSNQFDHASVTTNTQLCYHLSITGDCKRRLSSLQKDRSMTVPGSHTACNTIACNVGHIKRSPSDPLCRV